MNNEIKSCKEARVILWNPVQTAFYIERGVKPIDIIVSDRDGKLGFVFLKSETYSLFHLWNNREGSRYKKKVS